MADMLRLFIAIELPASLLETLSDLQGRLAEAAPPGAVRWVRREGIHLTLKFLGDVPPEQRSDIEREMLQASARSPFSLTVGELGCFPNFKRPRVVWVGVGGDMGALRALRDAVEGVIAPLGYPTEKRPFDPHLTLGRVSHRASKGEAAALGCLLEGMRVGELGRMAVDGFSLMRSQLRPSGAVYTQLAHIELGAADGLGVDQCGDDGVINVRLDSA